jgi:hypothetical protein
MISHRVGKGEGNLNREVKNIRSSPSCARWLQKILFEGINNTIEPSNMKASISGMKYSMTGATLHATMTFGVHSPISQATGKRVTYEMLFLLVKVFVLLVRR